MDVLNVLTVHVFGVAKKRNNLGKQKKMMRDLTIESIGLLFLCLGIGTLVAAGFTRLLALLIWTKTQKRPEAVLTKIFKYCDVVGVTMVIIAALIFFFETEISEWIK